MKLTGVVWGAGVRLAIAALLLIMMTGAASAVAWQSGTTIYVGDRQNITDVSADVNNATALQNLGGGEWLLNANLVNNNTANTFYINNSDVTWLKINSTNSSGSRTYWYYLTNGKTEINNTKITSWNTTSSSEEIFVTDTTPRSYVYASGSSSKMNISNSTLSYLGYNVANSYGVYYFTNSGNVVSNNTFSNNGYGIVLITSSNNTFENNNFSYNAWYGFDFSISSSNNTFTNNTAHSNTKSGIYLYSNSNNNTLTNNVAYSNSQYGIYLQTKGNYNILTNNTAYSNLYGIYFYSSSNSNILTNNTVYSNSNYGIAIRESFNNSISGGSVYSNTQFDYFIRDAGINNTFNNTNFSSPRKIDFFDNISYFNYDNGTGIWLNAVQIKSPTAEGRTTRAVKNWTVSNVSWSETFSTSNGVLNYSLTGLTANTQYQVYNGSNIDYNLTTDGNGVLPNFTINFALAEKNVFVVASQSASTFIPPDPISLANTTGNFWVNHTWAAGAGNITNSYNVSQNGTWTNGSANTYFNASVGAGNWSNITVWAWNSSGVGTLSTGSVSQNTQAPASFTPSNVTISCPVGWCYLAMNRTNYTLSEIDAIYSTDTVQSWYNSTSQRYESHRTGYSSNQNSNVAQKSGYAYYFTVATPVVVNLTTNPSITLNAGWNLVGNMQGNRNLSALKSSIGVEATLARHFTASQSWASSDSEVVPAGEAFFVYLTAAKAWSG